MADKKWTQLDELTDLNNLNKEDIELLTVVKDNTSFTKFDNRRIKLSDILNPINKDIANIKNQIQNIQVEGLDLTTIGIDPPYWYANEDDPENKQLVELSIAKELKEKLDIVDENVSKNSLDIENINENITDIKQDVEANITLIDHLQDNLNQLLTKYFDKNKVISTVKSGKNTEVPSSDAVFQFVKNESIDIKNYTDNKITEILNNIPNFEFDSFYFDNSAKNGQNVSDRQPKDVIINMVDQKMFVVDYENCYRELSLNRHEVLEIANRVIDWHNSDFKEEFVDGTYTLTPNEAHSNFRGKYVGKTNNFSNFICVDSKECSLEITNGNSDSLYATSATEVPQNDCYIIFDSSTKVSKLKENSFIPFIDYIKPEYKNLFSFGATIIKILYNKNQWRINFKNNSYSSNQSNFNNINLSEIFINNESFILKTKCFTDFYQSNSSEVFNDYKQFVPKTIDYFHSINNKGNKLIDSVSFSELIFVKPAGKINSKVDSEEKDCYCVVVESSEINLLDYVGYFLKIPANLVEEKSQRYLNSFLNKDGSESVGINEVFTVMINAIYDSQAGTYYPVIGFGSYEKDGIYKSDALSFTKGVFNSRESESNKVTIDVFEQKLIFRSDFKLINYYQDESDNYFTSRPSFIAGLNNLCGQGGQFIIGKNNIPTNSMFIIGGGGLSGNSDNYTRDNLFEIDKAGLIFIKSSIDLANWYKDDNDKIVEDNPNGDYPEALNLEYKCLQKILMELNSKITLISQQNSDLSTELGLLKNRISALENS